MRTSFLSSRPVNLGVMIAILFSFVLAPRVGSAQTPYTFTKIADTVSDPGANLGGIACIGLSNTGTVIIHSNELWRGNGSAGISAVAGAVGPLCPSINDLDEISHYVANGPGVTNLVRNNNGTQTTLASTATYPYLGTTYLPSLSHSGSAVFQARGEPGPGTGAGIYIGPGAISVVNNVTDPQLSNLSTGTMNDNLVVAFRAFNTNTSRWGIYRGSAIPLFEDGGPVLTNLGLNRPVINNAGTIAFVGRDASNNTGVFKTDDGVNFTFVGPGGLSSGHDRISINDSGAVAFDDTVGGILVGEGSGPASHVISTGDTLDGLTVQLLFISEESLNDNGQVAFWAYLGDCVVGCETTRIGVFRANPNRPPVASDGTASVTAGASTSGTLSATDPDGNSLTYAIVTNGAKGTATVTNATTGAYTYAANIGSSGTDTFTFKANDGFIDSNVGTIAVTITPAGSCATDISSTVAISSQGPTKLNKKTGRYTQAFVLKNGDGAISGPVSLVLDSLSANATLFNATGATACTAPSGSPYINVDVGADSVFSARERATVTLEFTNPSGGPVTYTTRVLVGAGNR